MERYVIYTDGSYGGDGYVHGGIVFWSDNPENIRCVHVTSSNSYLTSMNNVGGEILATYSAIMSVVQKVKKNNEQKMETYELTLVYDYKGAGLWIDGSWKAKTVATKWYVREIHRLLSEVPNLKVNFVWTKGHSGRTGNELADKVSAYNMAYCNNKGIPICCLDDILKID